MTELFYASHDRISDDDVSFTPEESAHIMRSCRRGVGDEIRVTDGRGVVMRIRLTRRGREVEGHVVERHRVPMDPLVLDLAVGMSNKDRMSWLVEKGTEIGMSNFIPLITDWSRIRRHRDDWRGHLDRWDRVAVSALKQSKRFFLPWIHSPRTLDEFFEEDFPRAYDLKILLDLGKDAHSLESYFQSTMRRFLVMVGPEGGFTEREVIMALERGFLKAKLIDRTLRFETAAISAMSLIATRFTDLRD